MPDSIMQPEIAGSLRRSAEIKNLAAALVKAQAAIEGARKDKNNPHFKTAYADIAAVWDAIREPLTANGLAVIQFPRSRSGGVEVETILQHSSGEFMSDVLWLPAQNTPQGMGSAITYARRYALMAVVGVAPVDDDGNAAQTGFTPAAGSAGGGSDFRAPNGRSQSSANGRRMAAEEPELVANAGGRQKGTLAPPKGEKKSEREEKTERFVDNTIQTLNLSGQTTESLDKLWKANAEQIGWIAANFPDQYERLVTAFDNARESAKAAA